MTARCVSYGFYAEWQERLTNLSESVSAWPRETAKQCYHQQQGKKKNPKKTMTERQKMFSLSWIRKYSLAQTEVSMATKKSLREKAQYSNNQRMCARKRNRAHFWQKYYNAAMQIQAGSGIWTCDLWVTSCLWLMYLNDINTRGCADIWAIL